MEQQEIRSASRRQLLSLGGAAGVIALLDAPQTAMAADTHPAPFVQNVSDFGAAGDAVTDDTAAFQKALDAVSTAGGGTVYAPPGRYLFRGTLSGSERRYAARLL